jgi:energy-converting hydrogenase Eha subunit H
MKPVLRERPTLVMAAILLVLVIIEATIAPHYAPKFPWHHLPGYAAIIGLGACLLVVIASKALGKAFLQRPEQDDD